MRTVRILSGSTCLVAAADIADTISTRMVGLLGRDSLPPGRALIIQPSGLIHTAFMRFAIDVLFLDSSQRVVAAARHVRPFRVAWGGWRARTAVELPAGTIDALGIDVGTSLQFAGDSTPDTSVSP